MFCVRVPSVGLRHHQQENNGLVTNRALIRVTSHFIQTKSVLSNPPQFQIFQTFSFSLSDKYISRKIPQHSAQENGPRGTASYRQMNEQRLYPF